MRKRGGIFSVSQSRLSKNAKSGRLLHGGRCRVNGASERAREQSASSNHRYVPSKRVITSEFTSRSYDHDMTVPHGHLTKKIERVAVTRASEMHPVYTPLSTHGHYKKKAKKKRKNRERKTHETTKALRNPHLSRCSRFGRR